MRPSGLRINTARRARRRRGALRRTTALSEFLRSYPALRSSISTSNCVPGCSPPAFRGLWRRASPVELWLARRLGVDHRIITTAHKRSRICAAHRARKASTSIPSEIGGTVGLQKLWRRWTSYPGLSGGAGNAFRDRTPSDRLVAYRELTPGLVNVRALHTNIARPSQHEGHERASAFTARAARVREPRAP